MLFRSFNSLHWLLTAVRLATINAWRIRDMQKKYYCDMKRLISLFILASLQLSPGYCIADDAHEIEVKPYKISIRGDGRAILLVDSKDGRQVECAVKGIKGNGIVSNLILNSQKDAIIVSDTDFVLVGDIIACKNGSVKAISIPDKVDGFLADVNLRAGIYLALGVQSFPPRLYLATVAKFGSSKNLVKLPGSTLGGTDKTAFTYDEQRPGRISSDGRYVAPSGVIECDEDSYPGVWDIEKKVRVVIRTSGDREKAEQIGRAHV